MIIMDGITIEEVKSYKVRIDVGTYKDIEALTDKINDIVDKIYPDNSATISDDDVDVLTNLSDAIKDLINCVNVED